MTDPPPDMCEVTGAGTMLGTPRYIAPEQARGLDVDARTDVYSLGCIAHELFLEEPPFTADNVADLLVAHLTETIAPPSEVWPDIPPVLEALIVAMLSKEAADRPTIAVVIAALEQARFEMGGRAGGLALGSGPVMVPGSTPGDSQRFASIDSQRISTRDSQPQRVRGTDATVLAEPTPDTRTRRFGFIAGGFAMMFAVIVFAAFSHDPRPPVPPTAPAESATTSSVPTPAVVKAAAERLPVVPSVHGSSKQAETIPASRAAKKSLVRARVRAVEIDPNATIDPFSP
jgi:serine/threonine protein kinase